jgi:signal transduction histidine kinase
LVGLNLAGTAALATFAYRASRESLEQQAALAVDVAARAREEALGRLLENRRARVQAFLASLESLCGERGPSGRFGWEREGVRVALSGFQTAERALAIDLRYGKTVLASRGRWPTPPIEMAPDQLVAIDANGDRREYVLSASRRALVVRARFPLNDVMAIVEDRSGLEPRGSVVITDATGAVRLASQGAAESQSLAAALSRCLAGEKGHLRGAVDGTEMIRAYRALPPVLGGGCLVAGVQYADVLVPIQQLGRRVVVASILFVVFGTLIALVVARATTRPLARLADAARALEAGRFDEPVPVGGPSEVRQLGRALSSMASSVGDLVRREHAARLEAEAANRTKDDFLAMLSHELRTPLTAILGWSSLMLGRRGDHPLALRALETIERSARTQARLIDDLLDVSRIVSGKLRVNLAGDVAIEAIVEAAVEAARPSAHAKRIDIQTHIEEGHHHVTGDAGRLQQVVANLLSNAVRYTKSDGRIAVTVSHTGESVEIRVQDSGIGIEPDFLPYVFERFRQADSGRTTRAYGGLGLGLAIARHLVELHGGSIHADSDGAGRGSIFTVRLPMRAPTDAPTTKLEPVRERSVPPLLEGTRVLVVDDDPETREVVRAILESAGALVATAASAEATRAVLRQSKPDVLIADIGMPQEDGYSLIRSVRGGGADLSCDMPAIALTAHVRPEDVEEAMSSGFQAHLSKPIDPSKLLSAVASTIARRWPN